MTTPRFSRMLGLALMLTSLAGCDASSFLSALPSTEAQGGNQGPSFGPGANGPNGAPGVGGMLGLDRYLGALNLTAEQKTKLQAINSQYAPGQPGGPGGAQPSPPAGGDVQALLTAERLDVAALRTALSQQPQAPQGNAAQRVAMLKAFYEVLTASQRTALADAILAAPAQPAGAWQPGDVQGGYSPAPSMSVPAGVNLTSQQQAAFDAFQAQLVANRPDEPATNADPASQEKAIATYFESGDGAALETALGGGATASTFPVDAFIALATSLSVDQRKLLFAEGVPGLPGGKGRPAPGALQA